MDKNKALLNERLRYLMVNQGLSQDALADMIESGQAQISRYLRGDGEPSALVLKRLALALNTTTDYLLGLSDEPHGYRVIEQNNDLESQAVDILRAVSPQDRQRFINALKVLAER
jgi:transcriptional regulator with XRE-family HTH domain